MPARFTQSVVEYTRFDILSGLAALCNALLPKLVSGAVEVSEVSTDEQRINGY